MPETQKIAFTPPDLDGQQVFWNKVELGAGTLFLPDEADEDAVKLLVPASYAKEVGEDGSCIGIGSLNTHVEAGVVHRSGSFAVKSAPFRTQARLLDWLAANLMMSQAISRSAEDGDGRVGQEILGEFYRIVTPQYFGALALEGTTGRSIIIMSDESRGGTTEPEAAIFEPIRWQVLDIVRGVMLASYPGSHVNFDNNRANWLMNKRQKRLVRLDLFGTSLSVGPIRGSWAC